MSAINREFLLQETPSFLSFRPDANALVFDDTEYAQFPSRFYTFENPKNFELGEGHSSVYGFVSDGCLSVFRKSDERECEIYKGEYFAFQGKIVISGNGRGIVAERVGERVLNQIGGPIEKKGDYDISMGVLIRCSVLLT
jgi:hypothetical protein